MAAMMDNRDGWIYLDGAFVPWRDAKIHVLTHTLHYGLGVFEGIRCYRTQQGAAVFRLADHTRRLYRSMHVTGMKFPTESREEMDAAILETIRRNDLSSCYIRPLIFYGAESMGLNDAPCQAHTMVAVWEWGAYLGEEGMDRGIRVKTSSYARHHPNVTMTRAKTVGNYPNSILAKREALTLGFDEALLLDSDGYVAEGSGENIFILRKGKLVTPPLDSALDGITRDTVFAIAADMGVSVVEQRFPRDEVLIADEAFFTGTAAEITPIRELDNRPIGPGHAGPVTKEIQRRFFQAVRGEDPNHASWLTPVGN